MAASASAFAFVAAALLASITAWLTAFAEGAAAGNPSAFRDLLAEGLEAHKVKEVWLYFTGGQHANHFVDITETLDQKVSALAAHTSQLGDWAASGGLREQVIKWASETATRQELDFTYAEGFQRIVLESEQSDVAAVEAQREKGRKVTAARYIRVAIREVLASARREPTLTLHLPDRDPISVGLP